MRGFVSLILVAFLSTSAWAEAPTTSLRPVPSPTDAPAVVAEPKKDATKPKEDKKPEAAAAEVAPKADAPRPKKRGLFSRLSVPRPKSYPVKGSVCNDTTIRGKQVGNFPGKGACGIPKAVRVTEVGGVKLSSPALINCTTAHRLNAWVQNVAHPAVGRKGGGLVEMRVMASYSCRTRNNKRGAKLSEHAKGRAVDIGGFTLADGSSFSVLKGWRDKTFGPILKTMHKGACGRFGTVLGPNSDRYHQDHFHFDTAQYRSGSYCR